MKNSDKVPVWACEDWGQYEHDWIDCCECIKEYEIWLKHSNNYLNTNCPQCGSLSLYIKGTQINCDACHYYKNINELKGKI